MRFRTQIPKHLFPSAKTSQMSVNLIFLLLLIASYLNRKNISAALCNISRNILAPHFMN